MATKTAPPPPPKPVKQKLQPVSTFNDYSLNNNNVEKFHQNGNSNGNHYNSIPPDDEQVVMTPQGKTQNSTIILIERKLVDAVSDRVHVAGGDHRGIIINKDTVKGEFQDILRNFQGFLNYFSFFLQIKNLSKFHHI